MEGEPLLVDVMGMRCPIPVQRLRMALRENPDFHQIHLRGDDPESLHDIPALLVRMGLPPAEISKFEGGWLFVVANSSS